MIDETKTQELLSLMDELIKKLEEIRADAALRQMCLEIQWLRNNLTRGHLMVPQDWQLLIFKPPQSIKQHVEASKLVTKLANQLKIHLKTSFNKN